MVTQLGIARHCARGPQYVESLAGSIIPPDIGDLMQAAENIVRQADVAVSQSERGSEGRFPLSQTTRSRIDDWIPRPRREESAGYNSTLSETSHTKFTPSTTASESSNRTVVPILVGPESDEEGRKEEHQVSVREGESEHQKNNYATARQRYMAGRGRCTTTL
jgi:hypothetical protein